MGDGEASADIINLSKFLPDRMWPDEDGVLRDRSDMGKETVEQGPPGATRHP